MRTTRARIKKMISKNCIIMLWNVLPKGSKCHVEKWGISQLKLHLVPLVQCLTDVKMLLCQLHALQIWKVMSQQLQFIISKCSQFIVVVNRPAALSIRLSWAAMGNNVAHKLWSQLGWAHCDLMRPNNHQRNNWTSMNAMVHDLSAGSHSSLKWSEWYSLN